ncbi:MULTISPECIES: hypothetical protein [Stappia]|uniref:Motility protein n=1 Tax=Stappia taiwanensis TaxID=992267 RepID=A0A838XP78_9HYPH|nr:MULTISPECIES: hypothetical protein [Stappia]MBA4611587.1 hypothetical protein [Stappia taiwanensis]MCA1300307.1 hypothetical protein [Stappia indica]GGE99130.1 hypothetical protein GCM10007285_28380 [Stappia taiwanensis]
MSNVAAAMAGAQQAQMQTVLAAKFMKMNASAEAGIVALLEQNVEATAAAAKAPVANGVGGKVDISV